jgi:hypothetical protein
MGDGEWGMGQAGWGKREGAGEEQAGRAKAA